MVDRASPASRGVPMASRPIIRTIILVVLTICLHSLRSVSAHGRRPSETRPSGATGEAPLTYQARTDTCMKSTDVQANGQTCADLELPFLGSNTCGVGCGPSAWLEAAPNVGGLNGSNTVVADLDFGTKIVRVTDSTTNCGFSYSGVSTGNQNIWSPDSRLFLGTSASGTKCLFAFSADSSMTVTLTAIHGSSVGGDCPAPATTTECFG